jgi:hypothetical protein
VWSVNESVNDAIESLAPFKAGDRDVVDVARLEALLCQWQRRIDVAVREMEIERRERAHVGVLLRALLARTE